MAIMTKEQKDIAGLGPVGVILEAVRLFSAHAEVFILIQLTLVLPLAIFLSVVEFYLFIHIQIVLLNPNLLSPGDVSIPQLASHFRSSLLQGLLLLLEFAVGTIVFQAAVSLSQTITIYSVGLHYAGQPVSFLQALRASTPRLWMRLAVTNACFCVLAYSVVACYYLFPLVSSEYFRLVRACLLGLVGVSWICLPMIFMVACGVSVLGEDCGWAAVLKSLKLLKGNVIVAVLFQLLWLVKVGIEFYCQWRLVDLICSWAWEWAGDSPWQLTALVCITTIYSECITFLWQFKTLCLGVQYVSFKASHGESVVDTIYEQRTMEGGYDHDGDGSHVALLGGQYCVNQASV